jgi:regulator of sigma E protease
VAVNGTRSRTYRQALDLARAAAPAEVAFTVRRGEEDVPLAPVRQDTADAWTDFFHDLQPEPGSADSTVVSLTPDSAFEDGNPSRAAGLPEGARILAVGGQEVKSFEDIRDAVASVPEGDPVKVSWVLGDGPTQEAEIVRRRMVRSYLGLSWRWATETVRIDGIGASIGAGLRRSLYTAGTVLRMIGGIFAGRVSAKNLGGPITIFQVSYRSAKRNFMHFLYFLGILSVNLAILNILPIPVLDGGHLLFILIEAIRRKPLSERAMGAFQWVGFLFLIMLMLFVIANDVGRLLG